MSNPQTQTQISLQLLELAPVPLWLEDFSGLLPLFAQWRAEGVSDLRRHLLADVQRIKACAAALKVLQVNRRALQLLAAPDLPTLLAQNNQGFREDVFDYLVEELNSMWEGQLDYSGKTVSYTLDGRRLEMLLHSRVLPGHEQGWGRVLVAKEDISEREQARRQLAQSERYARALFEHSPVSLWVQDFSGVKVQLDTLRSQGVSDLRDHAEANPAFARRCRDEIRVLNVNRETLRMCQVPDLPALVAALPIIFGDEMLATFTKQLIELWNGQLFQQHEMTHNRADGTLLYLQMQFSVLPGHEQDWQQVQIALTDISARKKAEAHLEFLSRHDSLTQLGNRSFFSAELLRLEGRGTGPVGVIVIDVNGLKEANDEFGHEAGDALLRRTAEVLGGAVQAPASASRMGGDEFVLLLPDADEATTAQTLARVEALLALNNRQQGGEPLRLSMGMAVRHPDEHLQACVHRADTQMYAQKNRYYIARERDWRNA